MNGKYVTFDSFLKPTPNGRESIYGEIVGSFQGEHREVKLVHGSPPVPHRTVLIIRLGTFSKDRLVEIPIECVRMYDTLVEAKEATVIR